MTTSVKILLWNGTSWATTVEFYEEEVNECELRPLNDVVKLQNFEYYPQMVDSSKISIAAGGREGWQLNMQIYHNWATTRAKVEQIIEADYKMRVYYTYAGDSSVYKDFVVDPNYSEFFVYGYEDAVVTTVLQFFGEAN